MPANPTWSLSSSGSGRRPTQFSARKRSGGTHWFLYFTIVFVAACIGGMSVYSWRALTRKKDASFAFDESRSVVDIANAPEFGQAAVDAELGQRDQNAAAQQAALRGVPVQEPATAQVGLLGPKPVPRRKRKIVLSDGNGRWNTGVWPAWGYDPAQVTLNWAAAGVVVNKYCPMECEFTRDQDTSTADAVVMELVNHPKFGIPESVPIPWPEKRENPRASSGGPRPTAIPEQLPLTVLFYFEAEQSYPKYTLMSEEVKRNIDISMTPDQSSTLPITLVCPWGKDVFDFLRNPKPKAEGRLLGYFNEHGVAAGYRDIIDKLFDLAGDKLHSFIHRSNRPMPAEAGGDPYKLATRLDFMGTYKFMLVTEAIEGDDWIEPDLSHVFAAGAVPVYIGAPNILEFVPGPRSIVHIRDFPSAEALWSYLQSFEDDSPETKQKYAEFFAWKAHGMAAFMQDEAGQKLAIGTGHGVSHNVMQYKKLVANLEYWAARPVEGAIPSLTQLQAERPADVAQFPDIAEHAWRTFRRQLDHCVHYAECRLCELVTLLT